MNFWPQIIPHRDLEHLELLKLLLWNSICNRNKYHYMLCFGIFTYYILLLGGSRGREFKSRHSDHISTMVLIRNHRAFFYARKTLWHKTFDTLEREVSFIVTKLPTRKSELEDLNPLILLNLKPQWNFYLGISFSVNR